MAKVLVIGSGGREQALAWKLAQSAKVDKVYVAPGNAGSKGKVENVDVGFLDVDGLLNFAKQESIDLTIVGQEAASEAGVVDVFNEAGLTIFGPTKAAVRIESSKAFSKDLMAKKNIPTATYKNFSDSEQALEYAKSRTLPVVIKADGLATGKGVIIAENESDIDEAIDQIMVKKVFGSSGDKVVVEDFLKGQEVSMHALSDGTSTVMFPASQDHKQIRDNDEGPNTGGMGAFAPVEWVTQENADYVRDHAVLPALAGLKEADAEFKGCLYPGLMIDGSDIKLLEFNARFGDPETEVYMRLLDSDLYELLKSCANGKLDPETVKWKTGFAITVVLASSGYPGSYPKDLPITGIEDAEARDDIVVFHAGTALKDGLLVTAGGRVLNVTATGETLDKAIDKAYAAVKLISFKGVHYRTDIGRRKRSDMGKLLNG
jgi:phosphoribosylamine--glycine ligase